MATVRSRIGLGRLLALGGPADGAWIAEHAVDAVLRRAARQVPGVDPGRLRIGLAEPGGASTPALPAPPAAVPPGPLRIEADFAAGYGVPLPEVAERLRTALAVASEQRLGLTVSAVDLRVTALLDAPPDPPAAAPPPGGTAPADPPVERSAPAEPDPADPADPADPVAVAAAAVPGVARLTAVLGPPVHRMAGRLRVELATAPGHRALDVARAVRGAVGGDLPVTVVVTDVVAEPG
ncbi:hypothetical protein GCM10010274_05480 [Streptomyces lavendofoliae]|uniref:Nucleopolyhedrovirus P10 family protein n=1 Tax=Streptomyces lavendofoliae TaxID=67314 RepID=A0A918M2X3_9ACTN|nr:hypothetical protein GCM10010274_05480 [Streptomyces lavendofoliae]